MATANLEHTNHDGIEFAKVGTELRGSVTVSDGAPGEGVPTGGDAGTVLTKNTGADYDTSWQVPPAGVADAVVVNAPADGVVTMNLALARTFRTVVDANVTDASFTNTPAAGSWVWQLNMDATGGYLLSGLPAVTRWLDGRSYDDLDRSANARNKIVYFWDGAELVAALAWNGVLELDAREMTFQEDGTIIVPITRSETLDLGDVTNLEADGTAGTGTLSYKKNDGADLALEPQAFEPGEVLSVTLTGSTTPSAVSILRRVT